LSNRRFLDDPDRELIRRLYASGAFPDRFDRFMAERFPNAPSDRKRGPRPKGPARVRLTRAWTVGGIEPQPHHDGQLRAIWERLLKESLDPACPFVVRGGTPEGPADVNVLPVRVHATRTGRHEEWRMGFPGSQRLSLSLGERNASTGGLKAEAPIMTPADELQAQDRLLRNWIEVVELERAGASADDPRIIGLVNERPRLEAAVFDREYRVTPIGPCPESPPNDEAKRIPPPALLTEVTDLDLGALLTRYDDLRQRGEHEKAATLADRMVRHVFHRGTAYDPRRPDLLRELCSLIDRIRSRVKDGVKISRGVCRCCRGSFPVFPGEGAFCGSGCERAYQRAAKKAREEAAKRAREETSKARPSDS
jgi:hypothetical protein